MKIRDDWMKQNAKRVRLEKEKFWEGRKLDDKKEEMVDGVCGSKEKRENGWVFWAV